MVEEARLEAVDSGPAPVTGGWFVVDVRDAAWLTNDAFGARCVFETNRPVLRKRPDLAVQAFPELGITLDVIWPGQPSGLYHAETNQEDFLVLAGECLLIAEGEERPLRTWDFVHCPPGTEHVFVGAGNGPCVIFMTGRRGSDKRIVYPHSELARRRGAGVGAETSSPSEAYAPFRTGSPSGRNAGTTCPGPGDVPGDGDEPSSRDTTEPSASPRRRVPYFAAPDPRSLPMSRHCRQTDTPVQQAKAHREVEP